MAARQRRGHAMGKGRWGPEGDAMGCRTWALGTATENRRAQLPMASRQRPLSGPGSFPSHRFIGSDVFCCSLCLFWLGSRWPILFSVPLRPHSTECGFLNSVDCLVCTFGW